MSKARVLVVDDEPKLVRLLREVFTATGFEVVVSHSAENAIELAALEQPDLIVLDIMFPGPVDGLEICRRIRQFSEVPVIMLTAKVRDGDKLRGFDAGADDYVTKPFNAKELVARVRALLKRAHPIPLAERPAEIDCGRLRIDPVRRLVTVSGVEIHLTPTEFNLLYELARHHDQVLIHEQLLSAVWGQDHRQDTDYLRAFIYSLRKKIEADPSHPALIKRYPGVGYSLVTPGEAREP